MMCWRDQIKRFWQDDQGVAVVIGTLVMIPLLLMSGVAIDGALGLAGQRRVQQAADAATHAGVVFMEENQSVSALTDYVRSVFQNNVSGEFQVSAPAISVDVDNQRVGLSTTVTIPTVFMKIGGYETLQLTVNSTAEKPKIKPIEIAFVIDVSAKNSQEGKVKQISSALERFLKKFNPKDTSFSIVPISTEVKLNIISAPSSLLFDYITPFETDEGETKAQFVLSNNYSTNWQLQFGLSSYFYSNIFPPKVSYVPLPGVCPDLSLSCFAPYGYRMNDVVEVLPLAKNRGMVRSYLSQFEKFTAGSDGLWLSLMVWGWRTLSPNWQNFWQANVNYMNLGRLSGELPRPYGISQKVMILITGRNNYWGTIDNLPTLYNTSCSLTNYWRMTMYGIIPMTTDVNGINSPACENYQYKTVDQSLGLSLTAVDNYSTSVDRFTYRTQVLNEIDQKTLRICQNIRAKGIKIYAVIHQTNGVVNKTLLQQCTNDATALYETNGEQTKLQKALQEISTRISNANNPGADLKSLLAE
jgi:Flp pilus assembly protein TadG